MAKAKTLTEYLTEVKLAVKVAGGGECYRSTSLLIIDAFRRGASVERTVKAVLVYQGRDY